MNAARPTRAWLIVVPAASMVVGVALAVAATWVVFQRGFGRGDLLALGVWSLPFGAVVAGAALVCGVRGVPGGALCARSWPSVPAARWACSGR